MDAPVNQSSLGVGMWKDGLTVEQLDAKRTQLLSVQSADVLRVAEKYLAEPPQKADTIIGPTEAMLKQNDDNLAADLTAGWKIHSL